MILSAINQLLGMVQGVEDAKMQKWILSFPIVIIALRISYRSGGWALSNTVAAYVFLSCLLYFT